MQESRQKQDGGQGFPSLSGLLGTIAFTEAAAIGSWPSTVNLPRDNSRMYPNVRSSFLRTMEK